MNNTANGGRKCKAYMKDGIVHYIRFVMVNNRRVMATYCNVYDGENKLGQTYEGKFKDTAFCMAHAEKILAAKGYTKA